MKIYKKFTEDQLNEVKELAKTKTLGEIAGYFNMSKATFVSLRKQQPEIDTIYYQNTKQKQGKLYTPEEILKIGELAKTLNLETIIKKLGTTIAYLNRARANQPELEEALIWVMKNRPGNFDHPRQAEEKALSKRTGRLRTENKESLFTRAPDDISPEEALARFRRLKEEDRVRRQLQELKEISQWNKNNVAKTKKD